MTIKVAARDDKRGLVLLTGLGFAGVGTRWRRFHDGCTRYEGYDAAPIVDAVTMPDDFGEPKQEWPLRVDYTAILTARGIIVR